MDRGDAGLGDYAASKAAIASLTRSAAREWGRQGITANAIAPGAWTKRGQDYAARDPEGFARAMAGDRRTGSDDGVAAVRRMASTPRPLLQLRMAPVVSSPRSSNA